MFKDWHEIKEMRAGLQRFLFFGQLCLLQCIVSQNYMKPFLIFSFLNVWSLLSFFTNSRSECFTCIQQRLYWRKEDLWNEILRIFYYFFPLIFECVHNSLKQSNRMVWDLIYINLCRILKRHLKSIRGNEFLV